jgi:hypothetical protein
MSLPWLLSWRISGCRLRMHWSFPIGIGAAFLLLQTSDTVVGYLLIIAAHHAGHYLLARRGGLATVGVDLHILGGSGHHRGEGSRLRYTLAGAGGLIGQGSLLLLASMVAATFDLGTDGPLYQSLTLLNLMIMGLNLLPISSTDGAALWSLPGAVAGRIEEKLTYMQIQEVEAQRAGWQRIIEREDSAGQLPRPAPPAPTMSVAAMLAEQDARADAGIPDALAEEVAALLEGAWKAPEPDED